MNEWEKMFSFEERAPEGFVFIKEYGVLNTGPAAIWVNSLETLSRQFPDWRTVLRGIVLTPSDSLQVHTLSDDLWHVMASIEVVKNTLPLIESLLSCVTVSVDRADQMLLAQSRQAHSQREVTAVKTDYEGVTSRFQAQIQQLGLAQAALEATEARLQNVMGLLPQLVYSTDFAGRILFCNHAFSRALKIPVAELKGKTLGELPVLRDWVESDQLAGQELQRNPEPIVLPPMSLMDDGLSYNVFKVPFRRAGDESDGVLTVATDISAHLASEQHMLDLNEELERRVAQRTAELVAVNDELESFSYSVSHDLRAPLRAIKGFAQILEEELGGQIQPEHMDLIARIVRAAGRMDQLTDDLLQLSRATKTTLSPTAIDLGTMAQRVFNELKLQYPDRNASFESEQHIFAWVDLRLIRVVLQNLIDNALKFTRGIDHAHISFGQIQDRANRIFFVKDNGIGFDMERAERLFTPFERLHDGEDFEGTGIGLATVKRVISRHGGQIWAESSPGKGTTIYFTLALDESWVPANIVLG